MAAASVPKLYRSVIEDVINNVREAFLDEGVDEQILIELKQTWEKKLAETKALEPKETEVQMSQVMIQNSARQINQHHSQTQATQSQVLHQQQLQQQLHQQQQQQHQHQQQQQQQQQHINAQQLNSQGRHALTHQLTLPSGNIVQQALLQYSSEGNDAQKTMTMTVPQKVTITLPAQLTQSGLHTVMSAPAAAATLALPPEVTASLLQQAALSQGGMLNQAQAQAFQAAAAAAATERGYQTVQVNQPGAHNQGSGIIQLDGANDTSDDDDDDEEFPDNDDDRDDNDDDQNDNEDDFIGEEEVVDPLNSEDDVSDDDPSELFETDNVVVCQYDKITRSRNRWKFHLKDGIMNLQGKDFVFQKAVGDAEW